MSAAKPEGLKRSLSWSAIGYGVYMLSQIAMIMIMTRLAPLEDVARYGVALSVATIVLTFTNLNLRMGNVTDTTSIHRSGVYVATRILSTSLAMVGIAILSWIFGSDLRGVEVGLIVGVMKCAEALCDLFYSNYQKAGRMVLMARSLMLRGPIAITLFGVVLYATGDIRIALVSQIVVWWSVLLLHELPQAARLADIRPEFDLGQIRKLVVESLPLGFAGFLAAVTINSPRLIVAQILGLSEAGIYTSVSYILQAGTAFSSSVNRTIAHRLAKSFQSGNTAAFYGLIFKTAKVMGAVGIVAILLSLLGGQTFLTLAFGPEFSDQKTLFVLLCVALAGRLLIPVLQTGLMAQRRFMLFARFRFAIMILMVAACSAGAYLGGMIGVSVALMIVIFVQVVVLYVLVKGQRPPLPDPGTEGQ
tara:strand:+ start:1149 stop:2402 length:1254 start_codon:yes stop_codon:yes gene_type:complete